MYSARSEEKQTREIEQAKRRQELINKIKDRDFQPIFQSSDSRKIITDLLRYREAHAGEATTINLLLADYYLKVDLYDKAAAVINDFFKASYYRLDDDAADFIMDVIISIGTFDKAKAQELLKSQLTKEMEPKHEYKRLSLVQQLTLALHAIDGLDGKTQVEVLSFYENMLNLLYQRERMEVREHFMLSLIKLIKLVFDENRSQLEALLFKQYNMEVMREETPKIDFRLAFQELVKLEFFKKITSKNLALLLEKIEELYRKKNLRHDYHAVIIIDQLQIIKNEVNDAGFEQLIEKTLLICQLGFTEATLNAKISQSIYTTEQLKILLNGELNSKIPRYTVVENIIQVFKKNNCFDEAIRQQLLSHYDAVLAKFITNMKHEKQIQNVIYRFEAIKKITEIDVARVQAANLAILAYYCQRDILLHIDAAIKLSKEVNLEAKETPVVLKRLALKLTPHKPSEALELFLKCHARGDLDALVEAANICIKDYKKVDDAIKYYKLAIEQALKTSSWVVLSKAMENLMKSLAELGGGFGTRQLAAIKELILTVYNVVFNEHPKSECKSTLIELVLKHIKKTKSFMDLSELFEILYQDCALNEDFISLTSTGVHSESEKQMKYNKLYYNLQSTKEELNGWRLIDVRFLISRNSKFFTDSKFNSILEKTKTFFEGYARRIVHTPEFTETCKYIFSSNFAEAGFIGELFSNSIENALNKGTNSERLFEFYQEMYHSEKCKNKQEAANRMLDALAKTNWLCIEKNIKQVLLYFMDPMCEKGARNVMRAYIDAYSHVLVNPGKETAKRFSLLSQLPAIAHIINRKQNSLNPFSMNPAFDYLCVVLVILLKEDKNKQIPEVERAHSIAKKQVQHLPPAYVELIQNAPANIKNVHAYIYKNVTKQDKIYDRFIEGGMRHALGLEKDDGMWKSWVELFEKIIAMEKAAAPVVIAPQPQAPSAPEKKEEFAAKTVSVAKFATEDDQPGAVAAVPSAPEPDEAEPGRPSSNPNVLFHFKPVEAPKTVLHKNVQLGIA